MSEQSITEQLVNTLEDIQRSLGMMTVPGATDNYPINEWASDLFHSCTDVIAKAHRELDTYEGEVEHRHKLISNVKCWSSPENKVITFHETLKR